MTRKKLPTGKELSDLINAEHFGRPTKLESTGPITPIQMVLEVTKIERYRHNPRLSNPEFESLKESIRTRGFEGTLQITKLPGDKKFTLRFGQGSTHSALLELFEETREERFRRIHCHFEPFSSESKIAIGHLIENDERTDLTLLERAIGIRNFQRLREKETGKKLSLGDVVTAADEEGYDKIDRSTLSRLNYALDELYPHIPEALSGMGISEVRELRALDKAAQGVWRHNDLPEAEFRRLYTESLSGLDGPDWDLDTARRAFEVILAKRAKKSISEVSFDIDILISGGNLSKTTLGENVHRLEQPKDPESPVARREGKEHRTGDGPDVTNQQHAPRRHRARQDQRPSCVARPDKTQDSALRDLRAKARAHATYLAQRNMMDDVLRPSNTGFGYFITDVPDPSIEQQIDTPTYEKLCSLWWELAACCEVMLAPKNVKDRVLPELSTLTEATATGDFSLVVRRVIAFNPGEIGFRLRGRLNDVEWRHLIELMSTHRELRLLCNRTKQDVWRG